MNAPLHAPYADNFKTTPYWWEDAAPQSAGDDLPKEVDVVIIGSGYCGLNAAIELSRNGRSVAVLERDDLGSGASTRSGGMVSSGQKMVVTGAVKGLSGQQVADLLAESLASFSYLKALVARHDLDADLQLNGRYFGAYTPAQFDRLQRQGELLREKTGVTVHRIERAEQRRIIGSDYYHGGIVVDEYGGLHVGKYHRSLLDLARACGARLYSDATVQRIADEGAVKKVHTSRGAIRAKNVVVATNGYTGGLTPYLQRRVIPVASYQIATAELPPGLMDSLNPGRRMISDSQRNLYYSRPSPDGARMLFGSRPTRFDTDERTAGLKLYRAMLQVYPALAGVPISHSWKGFVGMTFDKRAHIGKQDGVHYAVGCNGNGVALMSYLGYRIAGEVLDAETHPSAFSGGEFPQAFYYRGTPWFVPAATALYDLGDLWDGRARD